MSGTSSKNATSGVEADVILLRIWWEGVLMDKVEEFSVTESKGMISASMKIPASPKLRLEELIGTKLHVFYANRRVLSKFGGDPGTTRLSKWPILFQGELSGDSFSAGVGHRSQSLRFVGHSRHFDQTQLYFYDPEREKELDVHQQAAFLGNRELKFETSGILSKSNRLELALKDAIAQSGTGDDDRFIAYLSSIRTIVQDATSSHASFRLFNTQLKLDQRFGAHVDPDVANILTLEQFATLIGRYTGALPSYTSLAKVLEIPSSVMKYDWLHLSQPLLKRSGRPQVKDSFDEVEQSRVRTTYRELEAFLRRARDRYLESPAAIVKTTAVSTLIGTFTFTSDYMSSERTRGLVYVSEDEFVSRVQALLATGGTVYRAAVSVINSGVWPGKPYEPPTDAAANQSTDDKEREALAAQARDVVGSLDALYEFVVTPSMKYSQPPRCNVIVPDKLEGWSMQRNYFSELTRLYGTVRFTEKAYEQYIAPATGIFYHVNPNGRIDVLDDAFENLIPPDKTSIRPTVDESEEED